MGGFCLGLRLDQDQPVVAVHLAVCCWDLVLASFLAYQMILGIFPALTILWFYDIVLIISSGRSPSGLFSLKSAHGQSSSWRMSAQAQEMKEDRFKDLSQSRFFHILSFMWQLTIAKAISSHLLERLNSSQAGFSSSCLSDSRGWGPFAISVQSEGIT